MNRMCETALVRTCTRLRSRLAGRKEVEADRENVGDLLFPDAHLEVNQPVLFDLVAHAHEGIHQAGNDLGRENICWLSPGAQSFFCDFFLSLSEGFPGDVELLPQFDAIRVFRFVVVVQA